MRASLCVCVRVCQGNFQSICEKGEPLYFSKMTAVVDTRQQQAAMRGSGSAKPYSLFMMSPERVLGIKRAAEVSETLDHCIRSLMLRERDVCMFSTADSFRFRFFRDTFLSSIGRWAATDTDSPFASRLPYHSSHNRDSCDSRS